VESALARIAGHPVAVTAAGRTDRGVHARGQVAHFDTEAARPPSAWVRGVNAFLPDSVAVLWSLELSAEFHARHSALGRTYRYELLNRPVRPAVDSTRIGWFHAPLDVEAMREASRALLGEHDFSAFRAAECEAKTPVRTVQSLEIARSGERIEFVIKANAFLHHMVRNLVGSLVYVGCGRQPVSWIAELLASRDRRRAAPTFGAEGLYLEKVDYDAVWGLPQ
jgi:tRNA pseudouridine38-40 synthase